MNKITAAIVTYSERAHFVETVVGECIKQGVCDFVIIDNGSSNENNSKLNSIKTRYSNVKISIIRNDTNEGSAPGFKKAIKIASEINKEDGWVFVLDDDNKPRDNCVNNLLFVSNKMGGEKRVYSCFRDDREHYIKFLETLNNDFILGPKNSFMAFSISNYIKNKIKKKSKNINKKNGFHKEVVTIPCAPYGGIFFKSSIIDKIGLPNADLYLYFDDTEYTLGMASKGVEILLVTDSRVQDIDESWTLNKNKQRFHSPYLEGSEVKSIYSFRNRVYLERKYLVTNSLMYVINIVSLMIIIGIKAIVRCKMKRYFALCKAIVDGWNMASLK
ncbi:TPA: glycosyltransferase [Klebsiella pneumoniae]|uniref:glycosyltransferase n=1 Tax=Klebsiella pneumoniae complex TaxID=3390273 RepID=UPI000808A490|nr:MULTISPECIES: glycosyltransferase [Klebsiella]HBR1527755.1 glycosyltransferase [Klebsiella quasipneumoniae subsp. quasipneumoniae]MBS7758369.1 glycosyltransferase [Klebsiella pneumoniae]MEC5527573.1 glycosyltransferase [Klebsiella pneumoniae]SCA27957.1 glycosyl transferase [Klebsiella quasipneumoniae]HBR1547412.1 glycosyltransferase [Klebsiella pneumoniae]